MFPLTNGSGLTPLANTMDMLQPWMLAAIAALVLLMLVLIIVASRKSRQNKTEESMRIAKGGQEARTQTARKSQAERKGTRSARGEAPETEASTVEKQRVSDEDETARIDKIEAVASVEKKKSKKSSDDLNDEILKRAAERKKSRGSGKGKGSHAK